MLKTCKAARTVVAVKRSLDRRSGLVGCSKIHVHILRHRRERKERGKKPLHSPFKSAKHDGGRDRFTNANPVATAIQDTIILIHRQGDEAREPEQHGQGIQREDGKLVGKALKETGREGEVWQHQQGPDRHKDQEADFGRDIAAECIVIEPIGRCTVGKACVVSQRTLCTAWINGMGSRGVSTYNSR